MGGFYNKVAQMAGEAVESAAPAIARGVEKTAGAFGVKTALAGRASAFGKETSEAIESSLYHAVFPKRAAFQDIPSAKAIWEDYQGPYKELVNKYESQGVKQAQLWGTQAPHEIRRAAEQKAQAAVFGQNRFRIQGMLKDVENKVSKNRADVIADHLNIMFQEAPMEAGFNKGRSQFDVDMAIKRGADEGFNTPPSKYRTQSFGERTIIHAKHAMMAYKAALPHLTSNLNILISDGFQNYAKVLATNFGSGRKAAEATVLATNAISELHYNGYREKYAFDNGIIKQFTPGSVGEFIHRNMYIPGMSRVRYETVMMSAHASRLAAEEAAQYLARGNDRMAIPMLRELGIDPAKLKGQNFQLLQDDINKAYYHGTDFRAFLNQADNRTALSQRSPLFRIMGTFHNYVASQARFFRQVFARQYQQGDYVGIARNIGILGTVFPVMGASIYETERLLTGNDWDDPVKHYENRLEATPAGLLYDAVAGRKNAASAARITMNTIDALSHMASFGVATGYTRAAARNNLAGQVAGPFANMMFQGLQDALKATHRDINHPHAADALYRDLLTDPSPYGIGGIIAHKEFPTKAEIDAKKPKRPRFSRKIKHDSWNPLNSNDFKY